MKYFAIAIFALVAVESIAPAFAGPESRTCTSMRIPVILKHSLHA
jgi:hypothetical protein